MSNRMLQMHGACSIAFAYSATPWAGFSFAVLCSDES